MVLTLAIFQDSVVKNWKLQLIKQIPQYSQHRLVHENVKVNNASLRENGRKADDVQC